MTEEDSINKTYEYSDTIGKIVKILLLNNFHFTGKVLDVTSEKITILDKFGERVTLSKNNIIVLAEVSR